LTGNLARANRLSSRHGAGCGCCGSSAKIPRETWMRKLL
jgi:hypothetical protein